MILQKNNNPAVIYDIQIVSDKKDTDTIRRIIL